MGSTNVPFTKTQPLQKEQFGGIKCRVWGLLMLPQVVGSLCYPAHPFLKPKAGQLPVRQLYPTEL